MYVFLLSRHWMSGLGDKRLLCFCEVGNELFDRSLFTRRSGFTTHHPRKLPDQTPWQWIARYGRPRRPAGTFCCQQMVRPVGESPLASSRERLVKWRVVVAEKQRGFVGLEVKEGGIMINETEIRNLMMDTKRNRWWLHCVKRWYSKGRNNTDGNEGTEGDCGELTNNDY